MRDRNAWPALRGFAGIYGSRQDLPARVHAQDSKHSSLLLTFVSSSDRLQLFTDLLEG